MSNDPTDREAVVDRVAVLQKVHADRIAAMSPQEMKARGLNLDSARQLALKQVAKERGVSVDALRQRLRNAERAKKRQDQLQRDFSKRQVFKLEDFGLLLEEDWVDSMNVLQDAMHSARWHLVQVKRTLTWLRKQEYYPVSHTRQLELQLQALQDAFLGALPISICPFCKQAPGVIDQCAPCFGTGLLVESQRKTVPKQFWSTTLPVVLHNGEEKPLAAFLREPEQGEMF